MLRAFACAVLFLTRVPLPTLKLDARDFARSAAYFAWVGALVAAALFGCARLTAGLGTRLSSLLVVASWVAITGGLHLDGLADTVDGVSGGRGERARTLDIMRDSRIGAHGALALVLVLALKWAALERVFELHSLAWLMAPVVARFACTLLMAWFPYARDAGLGSSFVDAVRWPALVSGAAAVSLAGFLLGPVAPLAAVCGSGAAILLGLRMNKRLAGLTGDVYGAAIELAELSALLGASALR
ncbi:MAG: cobS [Myxococcaceae bacterium]|nr:cobS [Myxococcaceae bacterium]